MLCVGILVFMGVLVVVMRYGVFIYCCILVGFCWGLWRVCVGGVPSEVIADVFDVVAESSEDCWYVLVLVCFAQVDGFLQHVLDVCQAVDEVRWPLV